MPAPCACFTWNIIKHSIFRGQVKLGLGQVKLEYHLSYWASCCISLCCALCYLAHLKIYLSFWVIRAQNFKFFCKIIFAYRSAVWSYKLHFKIFKHFQNYVLLSIPGSWYLCFLIIRFLVPYLWFLRFSYLISLVPDISSFLDSGPWYFWFQIFRFTSVFFEIQFHGVPYEYPHSSNNISCSFVVQAERPSSKVRQPPGGKSEGLW